MTTFTRWPLRAIFFLMGDYGDVLFVLATLGQRVDASLCWCCSLAEAGDWVEVALAESHLPLVCPPLPRQTAVQRPQTPTAGLSLGPRAGHPAHPGIKVIVTNVHHSFLDCRLCYQRSELKICMVYTKRLKNEVQLIPK